MRPPSSASPAASRQARVRPTMKAVAVPRSPRPPPHPPLHRSTTSTDVAVNVRDPGTPRRARSLRRAVHDTRTSTCPPGRSAVVSTDHLRGGARRAVAGEARLHGCQRIAASRGWLLSQRSRPGPCRGSIAHERLRSARAATEDHEHDEHEHDRRQEHQLEGHAATVATATPCRAAGVVRLACRDVCRTATRSEARPAVGGPLIGMVPAGTARPARPRCAAPSIGNSGST